MPPPVGSGTDAEVEAAVAVRAMYGKFRDSLVECDASSPSSIDRAIRFGSVSLAVMIGSPAFGEARLADRIAVIAIQSRVLQWAREGRNPGQGVKLHQDLCTMADLLGSINRRQELQVHDAALVDDALERLEGGPDQAAFREVAGRLSRLRGCDQEMDQLLALAFSGKEGPVLVSRIQAALRRLAAGLPIAVHREQPGIQAA
jgi:hypothetical protein